MAVTSDCATGFTQYNARAYPFLASRPDTQLGLLGPTATSFTITTSGVGVVTATGAIGTLTRDYGSFSTYDVGRSLIVGGGNTTEDGASPVLPFATTAVRVGTLAAPSSVIFPPPTTTDLPMSKVAKLP